jgi:hypothetical protein
LIQAEGNTFLKDIGFETINNIIAVPDTIKIVGYVNYKKRWLTPYNNSIYFAETDIPPKLLGPRTIYMKLELNTESKILNNIRLDNTIEYFAKIPISNLPYAEIQDSKNGYLQNKVILSQPQNKVDSLSFSFYHYVNGKELLIDFKNNDFNFTLKIVKGS